MNENPRAWAQFFLLFISFGPSLLHAPLIVVRGVVSPRCRPGLPHGLAGRGPVAARSLSFSLPLYICIISYIASCLRGHSPGQVVLVPFHFGPVFFVLDQNHYDHLGGAPSHVFVVTTSESLLMR